MKEARVYKVSDKVEKKFRKAIKNKKNSVLIVGSLKDYFVKKEANN